MSPPNGAAPPPATARERFRADVLRMLSDSPKWLHSKYLYDEEGSRLFEEITRLPEYYPTRVERALFAGAASEIAEHVPQGATLVEFGSGASVKTRWMLDAAPQIARYVALDISADALREATEALALDYPHVEVIPVVGDFTRPVRLPEAAYEGPCFGFFPGSTIGNFDAPDARAFLRQSRMALGDGSQFLVGADLAKEEAVLVAAYDDAAGVTAAFNKNLLARLNRELDGDIDLDAFEHRAVWNPQESRIEMHLVSLRDQTFRVDGHGFAMAAGETIHTENSYKFTEEGFARLARDAGWTLTRRWIAPPPAFALFLLGA